MRILRVCFSGSKQTRQKALSTCTPHLVSLFNFSFGAFFEVSQSRRTMVNSTHVSYFILSAFFHTGVFKYLFFMIVMCLYVCIIGANVLLIVVICVSRSLHEPMYLFLCSLFVFSLYTYANVQFYNLAIMSYDRYLAICHPLHYNTRMTSNKAAMFIALTWFFPILNVVVMISLSASLQLCGNIINKVYCDNFSVVKLACSDTTVNNVYGLVYLFTVIVALVILMFFSYMRILRVCFSGSKQTRQKALSTCTPHLVSLFNFSFGAFFEEDHGELYAGFIFYTECLLPHGGF
ncbi:hypothetical protein F7725_021298 [Dissostichus mawsoni]|uniref:G-protein coupled receptors family 1 profile domain-containing protein n=1 Tax=Dissostichus mawsoni TaxID=36200 RepID=A0A7J5YFU9_DISMA|nr:hypothetical protein F7725_021298 [Dissostichus mawsoni]